MRRLATLSISVVLLLLASAPIALAVPSSAFSGNWAGPDPGDGSNLAVSISGETNVRMIYTDDDATTACADASSSAFTALLIGTVDGSDLQSTFRVAKCGNENLHFTGFALSWSLDDQGNTNPFDDVLSNDFGEEFNRAD